MEPKEIEIDNNDNELVLLKKVEAIKDRGNQEYSRNSWTDALKSYSEGIDLLRNSQIKSHKSLVSILYCNRSAVNIQLLNYTDALEDAKLSIANDIQFAKAYLRAGDCCIGLKLFKEAKEYYLQCIFYIKVDPNDKTMNQHNIMLTTATNGLNNSKMKLFYEPILRGQDDLYSKLELKYQDKVREKSLIAKVDVKKGETVFIDIPYAYQISSKSLLANRNVHCYHCMSFVESEKMKIGCEHGCDVVYCSELCRDDSWSKYHVQMCKRESVADGPIQRYRQMVWNAPSANSLLLAEKIIATISQSLKQRKAKNCNLALGNTQHLKRDPLMKQQASFNGENLAELQAQYKPLIDLLKQAYGPKPTESEADSLQYKVDNILQEEFDRLFSNDFYDRILGIINFNVVSTVVKPPESMNKQSGQQTKPPSQSKGGKKSGKSSESSASSVSKVVDSFGIGLYPIFSCMNHSCQPNVEISNERADGVTFNKVVFKAIKNIKAGQEILNSYCDTALPTKERQAILKSQYDFICKCNKCH